MSAQFFTKQRARWSRVSVCDRWYSEWKGRTALICHVCSYVRATVLTARLPSAGALHGEPEPQSPPGKHRKRDERAADAGGEDQLAAPVLVEVKSHRSRTRHRDAAADDVSASRHGALNMPWLRGLLPCTWTCSAWLAWSQRSGLICMLCVTEPALAGLHTLRCCVVAMNECWLDGRVPRSLSRFERCVCLQAEPASPMPASARKEHKRHKEGKEKKAKELKEPKSVEKKHRKKH